MVEERCRILFWVGVVGIVVVGMYVRKAPYTFKMVSNDVSFTTEPHLETASITVLMGEGNVAFQQTSSNDADYNTHLEPSFTLSLNALPRETASFSKTAENLNHVDESDFGDGNESVDLLLLRPSQTMQFDTVETKKSVSYYNRDEFLSFPTSNDAPHESVMNPATSSPGTASLPTAECYEDVLQGMKRVCRPKCSIGSQTFSLPGMVDCRSWLSCSEINEIKVGSIIGEGAVKQVHVGKWSNYSVTVNKLKDPKYINDFLSGLHMLKELSGYPSIVQLIGFCVATNTFVTEFHPLGNLLTFAAYLRAHPEHELLNSVANRLHFCLSYAEIVTFVHGSPVGTRVMCDSNELGKVLHQLLVTNGWQLVLNDLDAMPFVNNANNTQIVCGSQELVGDFVAPEQLWPYTDRSFSASEQPQYDEKIDIWKMPDVCNYFLGSDSDAETVKYSLFAIHKQCKSVNSVHRPTAAEVLATYSSVFEKFR